MIRTTVCLAAIGVLCLAPAADARKPKPAVNKVYAGVTNQGLPAYVKLLPHGQGVEAVFSYVAKCSDGDSPILWSGATKLRLTKSSRFGYKRDEGTDGPEITLDGKLGKKSAAGTWHVSFTVHDDAGAVVATCNTGLVNWTVPRSTLGGQTSAGYPIVLDVTKTKVRTILLVTEMKCQSGASYFAATPYDDFSVSSRGSFGDSFTDNGQLPPDMQSKLTITVHGTLGRKKAKGTWHLTAVVTDSLGNQIDTCDSGPLTWSAAP